MQPDLVEQAQSSEANIIMENHEYGMPPAHYLEWPELNDTFAILTTTNDRKGVEYVSTIEHKRYPFFGSQVLRLNSSLFKNLVLPCIPDMTVWVTCFHGFICFSHDKEI